MFIYLFISMARQPLIGQGLLIDEASNDTRTQHTR
jgi:hypothetical protein